MAQRIAKSVAIKVRVTADEEEKALRMAAEIGCNLSELIRRLIANAQIVVVPTKVVVTEPIEINV